jgi:alpha-L-fucosidase 2
LFLSVELSADGDPLSAARDRMDEALKLGKETLYEQHRAWWHEYWEKSALTIPDPRLENLYYAEMYKLACNTIGQVPVTTQGVWNNQGVRNSSSEGPQKIQPHHLDLNIQESYWPVYTSNHLELGNSLYEVFFEMLPRLQGFCRDFYGWDGAMADCRLTPKGAHVPCDYPWHFWTGNGPWVAHHFWLHYLYSQDEAFLREKAYPFMREFMKFFVGYLEKGEDGLYHLPWDCSPEYEGLGWDVTCSLALVRFLAEALLKSQDILGLSDPEALVWKEILDNLTPYPEDQTGLLVMKDTPLSHSHRHHSHLMPIHPLGLLNVNGGKEERSLISRSINTWLREGFGEWIGEVWPWASLIASRIQRGNMACMFLERYADAFISENSLNMNTDYKKYGLGGFSPKDSELSDRWIRDFITDRWIKEFSINGGFGAAAALLEMLLQSWTGIVRVFPAVPDRWQDAYFENLRAEGAFLVSSRLSGGRVAFIDITSEIGGTCRVHNPWSTRAAVTSLSKEESCLLDGDTLEISTRKGDRFRLTPEAVKVDDSELAPPYFERSPDQLNWFGVKKAPRF